MIDQTTLNFLAKLSLACVVLTVTVFKNVDCRALQNQQHQYSQLSASAPVPSTNQVFQYQQRQDQSPFVQQADSPSSSSYQHYYDQQRQPQQNPQYESFSNDITDSSSSNKPNRRSILSSIMAPFYAMRDQGMSMLQASLQGCNPNSFSMWCRFWSMFIRRR